jgi:hypothetical protein
MASALNQLEGDVGQAAPGQVCSVSTPSGEMRAAWLMVTFWPPDVDSVKLDVDVLLTVPDARPWLRTAPGAGSGTAAEAAARGCADHPVGTGPDRNGRDSDDDGPGELARRR